MQLHMWCKRVNAWFLLTKLIAMVDSPCVDSHQKKVAEEAIRLVITNDLWHINVQA